MAMAMAMGTSPREAGKRENEHGLGFCGQESGLMAMSVLPASGSTSRPERIPASKSNNNCYTNNAGNEVCNGGAWSNWVRWLVLGLIIAGALFLFFLFSCITARRRRRAGYSPYRGTAWAAGRTPAGHAPAQYNSAAPYYNNSNAPPPAYGAGGANNDYYSPGVGPGRENVEMQPPAPVYGAPGVHKDAYAPPMGPPPGQY
ncbi:hypothetical protein LTR62_001110 [Meristemomyces frigidus]|uniref:Uncharacterized protein n=1 Tax=Meristemomyces frigidus TaxID=1508187 RepID=A0AAN7TSU8_9PEZI|nr:hypothetical protein LTR62_001110 [Meristemomyces frigidus]